MWGAFQMWAYPAALVLMMSFKLWFILVMAAQRDRALGTRLWVWHFQFTFLGSSVFLIAINAVLGTLLQPLSRCSKTHLVQVWYYVHLDNRNEHSNNLWEVSLKSPQCFAEVGRAIWDVHRTTSVATGLNCDSLAVAWVEFLPGIFLLGCYSSVGTVNSMVPCGIMSCPLQ